MGRVSPAAFAIHDRCEDAYASDLLVRTGGESGLGQACFGPLSKLTNPHLGATPHSGNYTTLLSSVNQLKYRVSFGGDKKTPMHSKGVLRKGIGDGLLSHQVSLAVPSALRSLTSVFGMGTGVTFSLWSPKRVKNCDN